MKTSQKVLFRLFETDYMTHENKFAVREFKSTAVFHNEPFLNQTSSNEIWELRHWCQTPMVFMFHVTDHKFKTIHIYSKLYSKQKLIYQFLFVFHGRKNIIRVRTTWHKWKHFNFLFTHTHYKLACPLLHPHAASKRLNPFPSSDVLIKSRRLSSFFILSSSFARSLTYISLCDVTWWIYDFKSQKIGGVEVQKILLRDVTLMLKRVLMSEQTTSF